MDETTERHLTAQELADRLNVPLSTTYYWRTRHKGPAWFRVGRYVRYALADVKAWEDAQKMQAEAA
ncbi:helix-turn-helix transcriptional regulator [Zhihengliuella halotolerans]|uniref:helix-turn-helix transcriptional regulator n=1 Tax=Zhihengliuella halotolerans TaxID=370736 RepID=UPI002155049C|nr:helix-turn-helix domain-containing protein [Zhihengliuella halotolerans]